MNGTMSVEDLEDELVGRQLLDPSADPFPVETRDHPWFIRMVLGTSGGLAAIFVLVFLTLLFRRATDIDIGLAGLALMVAAFCSYTVARNGEFFNQLALTLSIAGQVAVVWAVMKGTDSNAVAVGLICAMQMLLLFAMPNYFAKVLAALLACCAWALMIRFGWWEENGYGLGRQVALGAALMGWFVVWVPVIIAIHVLVATESLWMSGAARDLGRAALTGLLAGLSIGTWMSEPWGSLMFWEYQRRMPWTALWPLLGALGSLLAVVYAFRVRSHALIGIATIGALLHVGQCYYVLGVSLLTKSCIMLVVGVLALGAAGWLQRSASAREVAA